ncbi:hypothetical protein WJ0W_000203 [Paenibacillus melissococcoides]|uniref:Uncharacterized protein n=1 Tax=Paenibacillus melissococcoides TaxID=2912268 RepID=A0ABN8TWA5_9BACL|nr:MULTISPECIES: hypothetical protein [Paenibacillus]MEB9896005.1 hypothetical protein [Bacillus cereus]CAH8242994.1 hypothetical protein WJ0W_000203 [Paenibacillus melissococcoides]CAH8703544.1 hypothetical protein WDD9_000200 [Paenibacillus melissococcoides]CAH8706478.1 hypothetical protein HTL2_001284 [Paenibacillus melissococcoides]GIO79068.1 hypothetical protein J6TS7_26780 [Paenibacillus dendritiformis]
MTIKEVVQSIVIHGFLGYLWVLFITHVVNVANSMEYMIAGSLLILAGALLFWWIVNRITPFHSYKFTHPAKIAGIISFVLVTLLQVFGFNMV